MEFEFTEEQEKLRKEVHEFFMTELPSDYNPGASGRRHPNKEQFAFWMELQKKAGKKGYLAPGWSKESGGLGLSDMEQGIVMEETGYWDIEWPGNMGLRVCGPPLHVFGTEEQKKKFLPPIASGEIIWYEAFTEPDAGSDEANVSMRAVPDGDDYILNGQKTFMTARGPADYLYTLARTADTTPKHRGLSLFLVPAHAPGISYGALPTMAQFTVDIFFDDVRVPKNALLGELNRGFYHAMVTFEFERTNTGVATSAKRQLEELIQFFKEEKVDGKPLIENPKVRELLAERAIEMELAWLSGWSDAWYFSQREKIGSPPPSTAALRHKTMAADQTKTLMDAMGLYGQLQRESKYAKLNGQAEREWQIARSTHPAGTIEVNKIVLAGRGLGLPRIPAQFNKQIRESLKEKK
ncbi:acyl-CoA dehydrogenase family protein [Chloroflexota bacterium]